MTHRNRVSLIYRIRNARDIDAWYQFADIYAPLLHRYATKRGLQDADAADLTQEVLSEISRSIRKGTYDPQRGSFRNWIFGIARHLLCRRLRQNQKSISGSGDSKVHAFLNELVSPNHEKRDFEREYRKHLFNWAAKQVREKVTDKTWSAFWRTAIDGSEPAEVARDLKMEVGSVYVAKSRVMSRIRQKLATIDDERVG